MATSYDRANENEFSRVSGSAFRESSESALKEHSKQRLHFFIQTKEELFDRVSLTFATMADNPAGRRKRHKSHLS
jgi:hypothetical protein